MTLQISPVLAGTYDTPDTTATASNLNFPQADDADGVDSRRYTKFDRSATDAGTATMSFGDFLDMINPLQHIPVVSSIYRELTDETINPVSRVVGDIVYGGVVGIASAVMGGISAAVDAVTESEGGKDTTGTIVAALFGDDKAKASDTPAQTTQLAQVDNAATTPAAVAAASHSGAPAPAQTPTLTAAQTNARAKLQAMAIASAASAAAQASMPSSGTSSPAAQMASATSATGSGLLQSLNANPTTAISLPNGAKSFALDPKKLPYGGVMAPPLQGNNMALSAANSAPAAMQMNHMIYTGRLMSGVKTSSVSTTPVVPPIATADATASEITPYVSTSGDSLPPALMNDIAALRAINTYRNTASQGSSASTGVNVLN